MNKILLSLVLFSAIIMVFIGCGGAAPAAPESGTPAAPPPAAEPAIPSSNLLTSTVSVPTQANRSTRVTPAPGDTTFGASAYLVVYTLVERIQKSPAIVIGTVTDILPAKWFDEPALAHLRNKTPPPPLPVGKVIYQDVVIKTHRYLSGGPGSEYIAIRVLGGKIDNYAMGAEDFPEFTIGEQSLLFLARPAEDWMQPVPEGFDKNSYYSIGIPSKYELRGNTAVDYKGQAITISELEAKIASIKGAK